MEKEKKQIKLNYVDFHVWMWQVQRPQNLVWHTPFSPPLLSFLLSFLPLLVCLLTLFRSLVSFACCRVPVQHPSHSFCRSYNRKPFCGFLDISYHSHPRRGSWVIFAFNPNWFFFFCLVYRFIEEISRGDFLKELVFKIFNTTIEIDFDNSTKKRRGGKWKTKQPPKSPLLPFLFHLRDEHLLPLHPDDEVLLPLLRQNQTASQPQFFWLWRHFRQIEAKTQPQFFLVRGRHFWSVLHQKRNKRKEGSRRDPQNVFFLFLDCFSDLLHFLEVPVLEFSLDDCTRSIEITGAITALATDILPDSINQVRSSSSFPFSSFSLFWLGAPHTPFLDLPYPSFFLASSWSGFSRPNRPLVWWTSVDTCCLSEHDVQVRNTSDTRALPVLNRCGEGTRSHHSFCFFVLSVFSVLTGFLVSMAKFNWILSLWTDISNSSSNLFAPSWMCRFR